MKSLSQARGYLRLSSVVNRTCFVFTFVVVVELITCKQESALLLHIRVKRREEVVNWSHLTARYL